MMAVPVAVGRLLSICGSTITYHDLCGIAISQAGTPLPSPGLAIHPPMNRVCILHMRRCRVRQARPVSHPQCRSLRVAWVRLPGVADRLPDLGSASTTGVHCVAIYIFIYPSFATRPNCTTPLTHCAALLRRKLAISFRRAAARPGTITTYYLLNIIVFYIYFSPIICYFSQAIAA